MAYKVLKIIELKRMEKSLEVLITFLNMALSAILINSLT